MTNRQWPDGFKIPRPGSRKHEVWSQFDSFGIERAKDKAYQLNIKDSTIGAWLSDWQMAQRGILPAWMRNAAKTSPKKKAVDIFDENLDLIDEAADEREGPRFLLEYQLRDFLAGNLMHVSVNGRKLRLFNDENGRQGVEYPTTTGPIDILAEEVDGGLYVFELKRGRSPDAAVGQVTRYMAWVKENLADKRDVFGVIVAEEITSKLLHSQRMIPSLFLFEYDVSFKLKEVSGI